MATGRLFCVLMSLLFSLNEHTFHTLAVVASGIQRVFANVVAIPLKSVNAIQIDNLRPVDAHEVRMLRQHLLNPPQPMVHHQASLTSQEHERIEKHISYEVDLI